VDREKEVKSLDIRSLTREEVDRFAERWRTVQANFVDDPTEAIADAELLVSEVAEVRGYPAADFEQRLTYLSVNHPQAAQNYRAAHEVMQQDGDQGTPQESTTEALRQAMNYYRMLINELLETEVKETLQWQRTTSHPT
jgi:DNA-binding ferritin-like protein